MKRRVAKLQKRLSIACEAAADRAAADRFKARFITLTVPQSGSISDDISILPSAWARLLREIRRRYGRLEFVRVMEWTAGSNGRGNSHAHVVIFGPYIGREWIAHHWGRILTEYGYRVPKVERSYICEIVNPARASYLEAELPEHCYSPMVDVRLADPKTVTKELVKYLVKDWIDDSQNERIAPELFAQAYAGLIGRRTIQTSVGYWVLIERECPDCGEVHGLWLMLDYSRIEPQSGSAPRAHPPP